MTTSQNMWSAYNAVTGYLTGKKYKTSDDRFNSLLLGDSAAKIKTAISAMATTMSDAQRLKIINKAADKLDEHYRDMQQFTSQNRMLSLQRSRDAKDVETTKLLYGIK